MKSKLVLLTFFSVLITNSFCMEPEAVDETANKTSNNIPKHLRETKILNPTVQEVKEARDSLARAGYEEDCDFLRFFRFVIGSGKDNPRYVRSAKEVMTALTFRIEGENCDDERVIKVISEEYQEIFEDFLGIFSYVDPEFLTNKVNWQILNAMPDLFSTLLAIKKIPYSDEFIGFKDYKLKLTITF